VAADLRGNFLIVGDDRYLLTQFHFHRPREECIHGKPYDMGLHLMHKSSDGKVAGIAVLLQADSASATNRQVWQPMPTREGKEQRAGDCRRRHSSRGLAAPRRRLFHVHGIADGSALHGGIPCFALKTPMEISLEQINAFATLYPHDVRPLQPLSRRVVKEGQQRDGAANMRWRPAYLPIV
jgi:carbonic anhydrase